MPDTVRLRDALTAAVILLGCAALGLGVQAWLRAETHSPQQSHDERFQIWQRGDLARQVGHTLGLGGLALSAHLFEACPQLSVRLVHAGVAFDDCAIGLGEALAAVDSQSLVLDGDVVRYATVGTSATADLDALAVALTPALPKTHRWLSVLADLDAPSPLRFMPTPQGPVPATDRSPNAFDVTRLAQARLASLASGRSQSLPRWLADYGDASPDLVRTTRILSQAWPSTDAHSAMPAEDSSPAHEVLALLGGLGKPACREPGRDLIRDLYGLRDPAPPAWRTWVARLGGAQRVWLTSTAFQDGEVVPDQAAATYIDTSRFDPIFAFLFAHQALFAQVASEIAGRHPSVSPRTVATWLMTNFVHEAAFYDSAEDAWQDVHAMALFGAPEHADLAEALEERAERGCHVGYTAGRPRRAFDLPWALVSRWHPSAPVSAQGLGFSQIIPGVLHRAGSPESPDPTALFSAEGQIRAQGVVVDHWLGVFEDAGMFDPDLRLPSGDYPGLDDDPMSNVLLLQSVLYLYKGLPELARELPWSLSDGWGQGFSWHLAWILQEELGLVELPGEPWFTERRGVYVPLGSMAGVDPAIFEDPTTGLVDLPTEAPPAVWLKTEALPLVAE